MSAQGQSTRARLIDATRLCVAHGGLLGATSRAITTEAGANLAAITYHFGSKDSLVDEALTAEVGAWIEPAITALTGDGDAVARMLRAAAALGAAYTDARQHVPIVVEALLAEARSSSTDTPTITLWRRVQALLRDEIGALNAHGEIPAWVEPEVMAATIMSVAIGAAIAAAVDPQGPEPTRIGAQITLLLGAVYTGPASGTDA
ncbi:MAG TPA: TetR/AcrR family transcriptional regulator [Acidimicrobiia bacterium]|nr:TetR/AcrR family transcriptional regulator [Acidimicrobiia bacterium]